MRANGHVPAQAALLRSRPPRPTQAYAFNGEGGVRIRSDGRHPLVIGAQSLWEAAGRDLVGSRSPPAFRARPSLSVRCLGATIAYRPHERSVSGHTSGYYRPHDGD